ncbi:4-hydroxy-3-methylbut-2-enyl diphosphate reductase [Peptostreptococcus faecalis]|uniref:4-hydroxy-3-methylbut-2-enyl diphosphate reductase n=1 Tax=Peptostreptococcus faecalis TaxID=2045015 RepID=UPI000C7BC4A2|nr:4-hydroxy-3-methylbut-2-enyl diphosphate reductase [Peptostreptococcus faecalis]
MKKIILAEHAGYCFGVKRAMNMAWNELEEKTHNIYALGPLIHNKEAVEKYENNGLITVNSIDEIEGDTNEMIIRSHGVSKDVYIEAEKKNIDIIDATCPFVKKIHNIVKKNYDTGKKIIIVGNKDHPEVIGINGWCNNSAIIVKSKKELESYHLNNDEKYVLVAQTTINEQDFKDIMDLIEKLHLNIEIENTICSATRERQLSARRLSNEVEAMIVVGGKHSSNTQKLAEICSEKTPTFAVETSKELKDIPLNEYDVIGIAAGASTPNWIIEDVMEYLKKL